MWMGSTEGSGWLYRRLYWDYEAGGFGQPKQQPKLYSPTARNPVRKERVKWFFQQGYGSSLAATKRGRQSALLRKSAQ